VTVTNSETPTANAGSHLPNRVPERQRWTATDLLILGGLAGVAAVAIAIGFAGVSRVQPIAGSR
jgi:hypothetical protein